MKLYLLHFLFLHFLCSSSTLPSTLSAKTKNGNLHNRGWSDTLSICDSVLKKIKKKPEIYRQAYPRDAALKAAQRGWVFLFPFLYFFMFFFCSPQREGCCCTSPKKKIDKIHTFRKIFIHITYTTNWYYPSNNARQVKKAHNKKTNTSTLSFDVSLVLFQIKRRRITRVQKENTEKKNRNECGGPEVIWASLEVLDGRWHFKNQGSQQIMHGKMNHLVWYTRCCRSKLSNNEQKQKKFLLSNEKMDDKNHNLERSFVTSQNLFFKSFARFLSDHSWQKIKKIKWRTSAPPATNKAPKKKFKWLNWRSFKPSPHGVCIFFYDDFGSKFFFLLSWESWVKIKKIQVIEFEII